MSEGAFTVRLPGFEGDLSALAQALRSGNLAPQQVDLLALVNSFLAYFEARSPSALEQASEALPLVARVIELKLRLLLPKPPQAEEEPALEVTLEAVTLLEELEQAIDFLKRRREARRLVLPARAPAPSYPRPARPLNLSLEALQRCAARFRFDSYFEIARERLTIAGAMRQLLSRLKQLGRSSLLALVAEPSWEALAVSFAGMLELYKEGKIAAYQAAPYAEIVLELRAAHKQQAA